MATRVRALRALFSPCSSLVAPPERLSPVRPVLTGLPVWAGQQRPGLTTSDPELQANPFSPFSRRFAISQSSATSRPRCRLHEHTALHAARFFFLPLLPSSFCVLPRYVFTEYLYIRAIRLSPFASPQTPHARDFSGISLLCQRTLTSV